MSFTADPSQTQNLLSGMQNAAQMAYYQSKLAGDADTLAFQKAQAAMQQAMQQTNSFGYAAAGNWADLNSLAANAPPPGTPTLAAGQATGGIGYIPGYTGTDAGQTMAQLSGAQGMASNAAGLTGFYQAPSQSQFSPGTFVRLDPKTYDTATYGDTQISYVLPSGQLQRVSIPQAKAMGWNGDLSSMNTLAAQQAQALEQAPPSQLPTQTLAGLSGYSNLNSAAQNQAIAQSGATGMYQAPAQIYAPGTDLTGHTFQQLDPQTQRNYYVSNGGDWNAAMQKWVNDSNTQITQWSQANGVPVPNQQGTPQETLAAQQQYFQQANALATQYGQYYAPGAPGQAGQAGVNMPQQGQQTLAGNEQNYTQWLRSQQAALAQWQAQQTASQNYLTLLSGLRGPADYAQYQKVLGATPGGMKDLVAAAAGQYIPGGGATTGVAPTPVTLQNFVGSATGQQPGAADTSGQAAMNSLVAPNQMAPQTWNALTDSQKQMLLGTWESQGYTKEDAQSLFNQSLPKYATQSAGAGTFKLQ